MPPTPPMPPARMAVTQTITRPILTWENEVTMELPVPAHEALLRASTRHIAQRKAHVDTATLRLALPPTPLTPPTPQARPKPPCPPPPTPVLEELEVKTPTHGFYFPLINDEFLSSPVQPTPVHPPPQEGASLMRALGFALPMALTLAFGFCLGVYWPI